MRHSAQQLCGHSLWTHVGWADGRHIPTATATVMVLHNRFEAQSHDQSRQMFEAGEAEHRRIVYNGPVPVDKLQPANRCIVEIEALETACDARVVAEQGEGREQVLEYHA